MTWARAGRPGGREQGTGSRLAAGGAELAACKGRCVAPTQERWSESMAPQGTAPLKEESSWAGGRGRGGRSRKAAVSSDQGFAACTACGVAGGEAVGAPGSCGHVGGVIAWAPEGRGQRLWTEPVSSGVGRRGGARRVPQESGARTGELRSQRTALQGGASDQWCHALKIKPDSELRAGGREPCSRQLKEAACGQRARGDMRRRACTTAGALTTNLLGTAPPRTQIQAGKQGTGFLSLRVRILSKKSGTK